MIREPEKKKEQERRRPSGKLSPWSQSSSSVAQLVEHLTVNQWFVVRVHPEEPSFLRVKMPCYAGRDGLHARLGRGGPTTSIPCRPNRALVATGSSGPFCSRFESSSPKASTRPAG